MRCSTDAKSKLASTASADFPAAAERVVFRFAPTVTIDCAWAGSAPVSEGDEVKPGAVADAPVLALVPVPGAVGAPPLPDTLFTVMLTDPDAPSPLAPVNGEFVHWLAVNCPGADLAAGESAVAYFGPAPGQGSGEHRYVLAVYAQPGAIDVPAAERVSATSGFPPRRKFIARHFAKTHALVPAGVLTLRASWEPACAALQRRLQGLPPE